MSKSIDLFQLLVDANVNKWRKVRDERRISTKVFVYHAFLDRCEEQLARGFERSLHRLHDID